MKYAAALFLALSTSLFAESQKVRISPDRAFFWDFGFSAVVMPISQAGGISEMQQVVIAVMPSPKSAIPIDGYAGYVEIRLKDQVVFSSKLNACKKDDLPITLRARVASPQAVLFTFQISSDAVAESSFSYEVPRSSDGSGSTVCVLRLADFAGAPNQASEPTAASGRGSP